jgi:D-glycero-alpha-D-manno-heptose-7-phosphate kinase
LDLWPLYNFVGGAKTVNVAIDIYTGAEIQELPGTEVILESKDLNFSKKYKNLEAALSDSDPNLKLLQVQLAYWRPQKGFHLITESQSPVGGGLGGSSSLTISIQKAFSQFTGKKLKDAKDYVMLAHNLEAQVLNTPTGTQDYFPAVTGGLSIIDYSADGVRSEVLPVHSSPLEKHFMLLYTGKAHHSGLNNFEVMQNAVAKKPVTMRALFDLKQIAGHMAEACRKNNWNELPKLFNQELEARLQLAPAFSSPEIDKLAELSLKNGASAVKICGAGGGGCVLVWCPEQQQGKVTEACQKEGFKVLKARPVDPLSSIDS